MDTVQWRLNINVQAFCL